MTYRSDLESAQRRVGQLEEELAKLPPVRSRWWMSALALAIVIGGIAVRVICLPYDIDRTVVSLPPLPPPEVHPKLHLQLYSRMGLAPILARVNDDAVEDVIVPMWDGSRSNAALHLVAIDGASFGPIWRAGPWPAEWSSHRVHLSRGGDHVAITDSQGGVYSIATKTGTVINNVAMTTPIDSMCVGIDGRVNLRTSDGREHTLDPVRQTIKPLDRSNVCAHAGLPACAKEKPVTYPCIDSLPSRETPRMSSYIHFEDQHLTLHVGSGKKPTLVRGERQPPYAEARERGTNKLLWEGPLTAPGDRVRLGSDRSDYANGRLLDAYQELEGELKVTAWNAKDGARLWATFIPFSTAQSRLEAFEVTNDRVYAVSDGKVAILDATDGKLVRLIDTISFEGSGAPAPAAHRPALSK